MYEIDADAEQLDEESFTKTNGITKQGYLLKGPEIGSDRMFVNIGSKSFKKRYCYLRQEVDGTYILELHKDDKKGEAKVTIVMDFCTDVVKVIHSSTAGHRPHQTRLVSCMTSLSFKHFLIGYQNNFFCRIPKEEGFVLNYT